MNQSTFYWEHVMASRPVIIQGKVNALNCANCWLSGPLTGLFTDCFVDRLAYLADRLTALLASLSR